MDKTDHYRKIRNNCNLIIQRAEKASQLLKAVAELADSLRSVHYSDEFEYSPQEGITLEDMVSLAKDYAQEAYELSGLVRSDIMLATDPTDVSVKAMQELTTEKDPNIRFRDAPYPLPTPGDSK